MTRARLRRLEQHQRATTRAVAHRAALLALVTGRPAEELLAEAARRQAQEADLQRAGEAVEAALAGQGDPDAALLGFFRLFGEGGHAPRGEHP